MTRTTQQQISVTILAEAPGVAEVNILAAEWAVSRTLTGPIDPAREALEAAFPHRVDRDRARTDVSPARHYQLGGEATFTVYTVTVTIEEVAS